MGTLDYQARVQGAPGSTTLVFLLLPFSGKLNFNSRHNVTGLHFNQTK